MRKWIVMVALLGMGLTASAQKMRDCFVNMPDSVLTLLTKNNRLDCVDFIDSKMRAVVRNEFEGKSELLMLTDSYLKMHLTDVDDVQMLLLPTSDTVNVICMVRTFHGPNADSSLRFYSSDWTPLTTAKFIRQPKFDDFWRTMPSDSTEALNFAKSRIDIRLTTDSLSETDHTLTCQLNLNSLNDEVRARVKPYTRNIVYRWKGGEFERDF